jgi:hypothetical protein
MIGWSQSGVAGTFNDWSIYVHCTQRVATLFNEIDGLFGFVIFVM